jgi:hypothetical protein
MVADADTYCHFNGPGRNLVPFAHCESDSDPRRTTPIGFTVTRAGFINATSGSEALTSGAKARYFCGIERHD